jgi:hypothetical protein
MSITLIDRSKHLKNWIITLKHVPRDVPEECELHRIEERKFSGPNLKLM